MLHIIPLPEKCEAVLFARKLTTYIYKYHGLPEKIFSDGDSFFMSTFWKRLFNFLNIKISPSSAYHPQTNGQTEIVNGELEEMICGFVNYDRDNWDDHLTEFEVAYNSSTHSSSSFTPFFLNYCIHPRTIPAEIMEHSKVQSVDEFLRSIKDSTAHGQSKIRKSNSKMASYANKKRINYEFRVGNKVWLSTQDLKLERGETTRRLHPKYCGSFKIIQKITPVTFKLQLPQPMLSKGVHDSFHVSLLQPYTPDELRGM